MNPEEPEKSVDGTRGVVDPEDPNLESEGVPPNTDGDAEAEKKDVSKTSYHVKDDVILIHPNNVLKALRAFVEKYKNGDHKYIFSIIFFPFLNVFININSCLNTHMHTYTNAHTYLCVGGE